MDKFEIKNTSNSIMDGIKILIYGASGVGKTTQLGEIEGKVLILSAESGLLVLKDKQIDVIDIDSVEKLGNVYLAVKNKELDYETICIDSLSEIGDMVVNELEQDEYYGNPSNTFKLWMEYTKRMINIVKLFRDLKGVNVVFTALSESVEYNGMVKFMPQIPAKKAQSKLVSLFDEVYYYDTNSDGERIIHTSDTAMYAGKSRAGLEETMVVSDKANLGTIIKNLKDK